MFPLPFDDEPPPTPEKREAIWTVNLIMTRPESAALSDRLSAGGAPGGLLFPHQMIPHRLGEGRASGGQERSRQEGSPPGLIARSCPTFLVVTPVGLARAGEVGLPALGTSIKKRRDLMAAWAAYCVETPAKVVSIAGWKRR